MNMINLLLVDGLCEVGTGLVMWSGFLMHTRLCECDIVASDYKAVAVDSCTGSELFPHLSSMLAPLHLVVLTYHGEHMCPEC